MSYTQKDHQWRNWTGQLKGDIQGAKDTEMDNFTSLVFDWWRGIDSNDEIEEKGNQLKI